MVSPYATFLALTVDAHQAVLNLQRMRDLSWLGELGFYDAAEFAPARVAPGEGFKLVRCWMAHHQGMSLLATCNLLLDGAIQKLFHSEPAICATELLLHEKPSLGAKPEERAKRVGSFVDADDIRRKGFGTGVPIPRTDAPVKSQV